ncbi:MAG: hypothetical protein ACI9NQ_000467 [Paracoccaceae bacterium]|jgi:hypothetical protein
MNQALLQFLERHSGKVPWPILYICAFLVFNGWKVAAIILLSVFALKPVFEALEKAANPFRKAYKSWKKACEEVFRKKE